jgi:hypothetical protein
VLTAEGPRIVDCRSVREVRLHADRNGQLKAPSLFFSPGSQRQGRALPERWRRIVPYARFPGGLPDSLDLASLRLPSAP